jgi:hypothetical protein
MDGAVCNPNISAAGRRRRRLVGYVASGIAAAMLAGFVVGHAGWWWRTLVFMPTTIAAIGFLQARRGTCVAHAARGTFEHEDFSTTKAPDDEVAASRRVAALIRRDALLFGFACAAIAAATATLF